MSSSLDFEWKEAPELPTQIVTRGRAKFNPRNDHWRFSDRVFNARLDFRCLNVSAELLLSFKRTLIWYAENRSVAYLEAVFRSFVKFINILSCGENEKIHNVRGVDVLNLRPVMGFEMKKIASLFKRWDSLKYPGLDIDVIPTLSKIKTKGNPLGIAVLTQDPRIGPFSPIEQTAIQDALNDAWKDGKVSEAEFLLIWLLIVTGARPVQLAALKLCDLSCSKSGDEAEVYFLHVPRAKQRNETLRSERKPRILVSQIGRALRDYSTRVRDKFSKILSDPNQAPMFPISSMCVEEINLTWGRYHNTAGNIGVIIKESLSKLKIRSERTGEFINISAIRFRRTIGTNAAQEGHGVHVIAELLDHSGIETVGVYVAATPEIAGRIDKATALHMAPLAQAFKGTLVQSEFESSRAGDTRAKILDLRIDQSAKPMGCCQQSSDCRFLAPIACYTCTSFEAWSDGPHEAVLEHLLKQRKHLSDKRISAINDRTILAVASVVLSCRTETGEVRG